MKSALLALSVLVVITLVPLVSGTTPVLATNPCSHAEPDPDPPIGEPDLIVGGHIEVLGSGAVDDATVTLYWCDGSSAVEVTSTETDSGGDYEFTAGFVEGKWHYVMVSLTGPLEGMTPSMGTSNPSDFIAIGYGDDEVDFTFVD